MDDNNRPISAWGYVGYSLLFCLPLIGLILIIVFSLSESNINRRNYARSYLCWLLLAVVITVLITMSGVMPAIQSAWRQAMYYR